MRNLTMLTDFYQLTMMQAYFDAGRNNHLAAFDLFFRAKEKMAYCVFAGLEQVVEYIQNIKFSDEDIAYLKNTEAFSSEFLHYLTNFSFTGDIYSVREGEIVFPNEPIVTVVANLCESQFVETAILNIINHQTLIATKASHIRTAAQDKTILEFGMRRAQGPDAAVYGSRASIIGGCNATSNVYSGQLFGLNVSGTLAHSFIQSFDCELDAFRAYAKTHSDRCLLLIDTYDTLKSGLPNALTVFKELAAMGKRPFGIRIDSGDLAYLSKKVRNRLDEEGFSDCKICATGDLDEFSISSLRFQNAEIDIFGVGTKLITSEDVPSLGGVYKLCAIESDGGLISDAQVYNGIKMAPSMKLSGNSFKITNPCIKKIVRIFGEGGMAEADLLMLFDEEIDITLPLTIFSPTERWKKMTFENYSVKNIVECVIKGGKPVKELPGMNEIINYANNAKKSFWQEYMRIDNPHIFKVDLSEKLLQIKDKLIDKISKNL